MNAKPTLAGPGSLRALQQRAKLYRDIHNFFRQRGVMAVETPALSAAGNTDPYINSFHVKTPSGMRYLHTSPEYPMKRLLAAGSGDIYQICKVWRDDESGTRHNPEFTMLEYYRVGFSYQRLMVEVSDLLHLLLPTVNKPAKFVTYRDCFLENLGINPHISETMQLAALARAHKIDIAGNLSKQDWLDLLFTHLIEPGFAQNQLTFVYHYPAEQSALANISLEQGIPVAERFEVYCGATELGNGYQELTDPQQNAAKLNSDARRRQAKGLTPVPVDQHFLDALQRGLPRSAGVAIGLDRVLLRRLQANTLNQVISFPWELA